LGGEPLRFDENGPLAQPVILVTMAADDSPRTKVTSKRIDLIFIKDSRFSNIKMSG
jgi:hypothetical protein